MENRESLTTYFYTTQRAWRHPEAVNTAVRNQPAISMEAFKNAKAVNTAVRRKGG